MKPLFLCLLILGPLFANAQKNKNNDSLAYYYRQLRAMEGRSLDSLRNTEAYKEINNHITRLQNDSISYVAFYIGFEAMHSDYAAFNASIADSGYKPLDPVSLRFVFGLTRKSGHHMFDIFYAAFGIPNKSAKGNDHISANLSNIMSVSYGYDLLNTPKASIYPYGGLSLRISTLRYKKDAAINPGYTNISNIIASNQAVKAISRTIGWQLGLTADVRLSGNLMLSANIATNRAFGSQRYNIEGTRYKPGITQGDWQAGIGIKFTDQGE